MPPEASVNATFCSLATRQWYAAACLPRLTSRNSSDYLLAPLQAADWQTVPSRGHAGYLARCVRWGPLAESETPVYWNRPSLSAPGTPYTS